MYGAVAADHLKSPRNLGKLDDADGVGRVDEPSSDTLVTVYLKLGRDTGGQPVVAEARFRAFGCGGCIITASIVTELATGRPLAELALLDGAAINRALDDGLPLEQRYCAELAARALHLAADAARGNPRPFS
jgi:nitrogen fixation NifU-like protein